MALPASLANQSDSTRQLVASSTTAGSTNAFGATYFVDAANGSDTLSGHTVQDAMATIASAITASQAGDTLILSPGTHSVDVSVAALAPKADTRIVGAIPSFGGMPSTVITHDADDGADLILVDVDGVVFQDIKFLMVAGASAALRTVAVAQTTAVNGLSFVDCWFDQNSVDISGVLSIAVNDATNATVGLVVKNCRFLGGDATSNQPSYIQIGAGGTPDLLIEDCVFVLEAAGANCYGVDFLDPVGTGKSYGFVIRNNDFIGPTDAGEDGLGVFFASATTETELIGIIRTNYFAYCALDAVTQDEAAKAFVRNYVGENTAGGAIVTGGA